jgi:ribosome recycling factor
MAYNFTQTKEEFSKIEEWLKSQYTQISTGRANPALVDSVMVESYGSFSPIKNIASITVEEARVLRISPWDKGIVKDIERAIRESGLPLSVVADGNGLRASIPQLTEESKKTVVKLVKEKLEEARVSVRMERQRVDKEIDATEKEGNFSEDDKFRAKDDMQKMVDDINGRLESLFQKKEEDIMTV